MDLRSQQRLHTQPRQDASATPLEGQQAHAAPQHRRLSRDSGSGSKKAILLGVVALVVLGALAAAYMAFTPGGLTDIKSNQYQAVFLTNGQVYFGKISRLGNDTVALKAVYYLQESIQSQDKKTDTSAQNQLSLTKLGNELHGPEDTMFIERKQVLFWENLKDDSQVVKKIKEAETKKP